MLKKIILVLLALAFISKTYSQTFCPVGVQNVFCHEFDDPSDLNNWGPNQNGVFVLDNSRMRVNAMENNDGVIIQLPIISGRDYSFTYNLDTNTATDMLVILVQKIGIQFVNFIQILFLKRRILLLVHRSREMLHWKFPG